MLEKTVFEQYLVSLLSGDRDTCTRIVTSQLEKNIGIKTLYTDLFQQSMYRIGEMWEHNQITVAVEHLATSITQQIMNLVYPRLFAGEKVGRKAVIACVANEYHQIGSRMVADIFELNGWDGYYLGSNTPVRDLLAFIEDTRPDVLGLSLAIYFNMQVLHRTVEAVRDIHPELPILLGGQAFRWGGRNIQDKYHGIQYIDGIEELEHRILENGFNA